MRLGYQFNARCVCGDQVDYRTAHADTAEFMEGLWSKLHQGEGHGPATPSQAAAARRPRRRRAEALRGASDR